MLKAANDHALVLQPGNSEEIVNICCCCGCCCRVLTSLNKLPAPADFVSSLFTVEADVAKREGCETCVERCQMDALSMADEKLVLNSDRCIGSGLRGKECLGGFLQVGDDALIVALLFQHPRTANRSRLLPPAQGSQIPVAPVWSDCPFQTRRQCWYFIPQSVLNILKELRRPMQRTHIKEKYGV